MNDWKIRLPNYLRNLQGQQLWVSGCRELVVAHRSRLLKAAKKSTRHNYLHGKVIPLDLLMELIDENEVELAFLSAGEFSSRSKPGVVLPKFLTPELAYLVGALRDGSLYRHGDSYTVSVAQSGEKAVKWLDYIAELFFELFRIKLEVEDDDGDYRLRANSKPLALFFESVFEMPSHQAGWSTPRVIEASELAWKHYVAGFFDAEGYCPRPDTVAKTQRVKIKFAQTNRQSLEFIKRALRELKISSSQVYKLSGRDLHELYVYGLGSCINFCREIPVVRKREELEDLVDSPQRVPSEVNRSSAPAEARFG